MAMNREAAEPGSSGPQDDLLARAAAGMRELTDDGWVRARRSVLARVLSTVRPSAQVVGRHGDGPFVVATSLVVDRVRAALDDPDGEVRVTDVRCLIGPADDGGGAPELEGVTVILSVRFGTRIADAAELVRAAAADAVSAALGTDFEQHRVSVDLHVADVHPSTGAGGPVGAGQPET
ncbi:hypothetical protein ACQFYA_01790 [Promicromonospora sp. Marseille-Q5078]